MNKADLIEVLAPRLGGRAVAALAVESLVDVVLREVANGGAVGITGFGTFERVDRAARTGRNPRTGDAVPIAATSLPRFRPGAYFKDVVDDPSALPADGLAGVRVGSTGELSPSAEGESGRSGTRARPVAKPSIRRTADDAASPPKTGPATAAKAGAQPSSEDPMKPARRTRTSGTPQSVKAPKPAAEAPETEDERPARATARRRPMTSGEEITAGMISAKKAQLAQVKNDEIAAKEKKAKKKDKDTKDKDKVKDKDRGAAPEKAKKGKKKK